MVNFLREALQATPQYQAGAQRRREQDDLNKLRSIKLASAQGEEEATRKQRVTDEELRQTEISVKLAEGLLQIPDIQERTQAINSQIPMLKRFNFDDDDLRALYDPDPNVWEQKLNNMQLRGKAFLQEQQGLTSGQREFNALTKGLPEEDTLKARRVKLGLEPRAQGSAAQTILNLGTADRVADVEATLSGAKERGKLTQQLRFKPQIQKAIKLAESEAKERGEVLTDLERARSALPGLNEAVSELKRLAPIATSTFSGRAFDLAAKELGFGSTKGATARKKFIAIVNNQVLPLLKPTFGAAFTVAEGEALRATMGDPNSTPEEKLVELDAFIENKIREIETKERQLGEKPQGQIMQDANGNRAIVYPDGSFEEID